MPLKTKTNNYIISIPTLLIGPLYYIYSNIFLGWVLILLSYPIYLINSSSLKLFILIIRNIILSLIYGLFKHNKEKLSKQVMIEIIIIHLLIIIVISNIKTIEKESIQIDHLNNMYYLINKDYTSNILKDEHRYVKHLNNNTCYITINYSKTNLLEKDFLVKETESISDPSNIIIEREYNDITWYNRKIDNIDFYITRYNNEIYEIKIESTNNNCDNDKEELLKSITFKNN